MTPSALALTLTISAAIGWGTALARDWQLGRIRPPHRQGNAKERGTP